MTQVMSLAELKAQNAAAEQAELEAETVDAEEVEDEIDEAEVDEQADDDSEESESEGEEESDDDSEPDQEDDELEDWMKGSDDRTVPLSEHIELRQKIKHQRNEAEEKAKAIAEENARLKREIEELKANSGKTSSEPVAPNLKDFEDEYGDIDYNGFNQANAKYTQELIDHRLNAKSSDNTVNEEAQNAELEKAVNGHYEKAENLVKSGVISADSYAKADRNIVDTFDSRVGGQGRQLADYMIKQIAEISDEPEKLWYKLGVDSKLLHEIMDDFANDPTGNKGIIHLTKVDKQLSKSRNIRSKAPKPVKQISGGNAKSSSMLRRYKEAHKKGNSQEAFNIKREAKQNKIDVSKW